MDRVLSVWNPAAAITGPMHKLGVLLLTLFVIAGPAFSKKHKSTRSAKTSHRTSHRRSSTRRTTVKSNVKTTRRSGKVRRTAVASRAHYSVPASPTPDRYREIQQALSDKGYYKGEVNGQWGPEASDALKRFQAEQNLESDGKLNSLSLIALGLGPKRTLGAQAGGLKPIPQPPPPVTVQP